MQTMEGMSIRLSTVGACIVGSNLCQSHGQGNSAAKLQHERTLNSHELPEVRRTASLKHLGSLGSG